MRKGLLLAVVLFAASAVGQTVGVDTLDVDRHRDSLKRFTENMEWLYQRLLETTEEVLEETENGFEGVDEVEEQDGFEELIIEYKRCREEPINLNGEAVTRLGEMGLLGPFQVEAIRQYRQRYGDFLFVEELMMVEGFDERMVAVISPIVCIGKSAWKQEQEKVTLKKAMTKGRHQLTMNYAQKLSDTTHTDYLGSPMKAQLRYCFSYGSKIRLGFAMEKDAGEPFLFGRLSDSIQQVVRSYRRPGFDFYGVHLYLTDLRLVGGTRQGTTRDVLSIKDLAIGDYQLSFGQGLTLWSGMSFGKAGGGSSLMKRGAGVRPKASAGEGKFFRGAATTLQYRNWQATVFYSLRNIDATVVEADTLEGDIDDPELVSALQESGYHRTLGELEKRHTLRQQVFGGHLCYTGAQLEVGLTAYHLRLGAPLQLKPSKYNQYYFQGDRLTDMGLDFRWQLTRAVFFGEFSASGDKAFAGLAGMTVKPAGYIDFTLLYRNYGLQYQNLFLGALKESSRGQAEEGFYLGLQCAPAPRWNLLAHCDFFRFKWLTSQVYTPSWGQEYSVKVDHQISDHATMQFRFRSKAKMKNSTDNHSYSYYPIFYAKRSVQFQVTYILFGDWVFGNKACYSHYLNDDGADSRGYLVCQDAAYKPEGKPWSLTFRYALFGSDDYNSRISLYENDVLGAFSIPGLYGHGSRVYLLGKLRLFNTLTLYAKMACSILNEETKTDIKAEAVWKF